MGNSAGFVNENPLGTTLKIFATGPDLQTFELKAKSNVFGVVYAPNADVELYPKAELLTSGLRAKAPSITMKH